MGGQNVDTLFDDPFFSGSAAAGSTLVPGVYQVSIGGHPYIIEPKKYNRVTVPLHRESTDQSVEPGEQSLNSGGAWRRSQDNWFLGAGQAYLDNRFAFVSVYTHSGEDPSVRTRFWRSKGIDPWSEGQLKLLPEQEQKGTSAGTGQLLQAIGTYLYWWDGTTLYVSVNPSSHTPTWTAIVAPTGGAWPVIHSMTTDGSSLYMGLGVNGIGVLAAGSGTATYLRPTETAPGVAQVGTPGVTSYIYYVVAVDANGFKSLPSPATTTTTGNAVLSGTNYNRITWAAVPGAVSYDVLKTDTAHSIATAIAGLAYNDDGSGSFNAYTTPTATTLNFQATFVAYGNSFLLAGAGPQLCNIAANGTTTQVILHRNSSFVWNAGGGSPMAIYVAGYAGGVSELYGIQLSTTTFGLGAPFIAGQVSDGEIVNALCYYQGVVVLSTSLGVRAAQDTNSNGHLTTGPVITSLGASLTCAPYGAFVWFGISNFSEADGIYQGSAVSSGTGRLYLSEFSNPLLPAYTTDILATDAVTGNSNSITIFGGTPYFAIDGSGVWGPSGNVVAKGYLEAGWVRYGTVENKILVSGDLRHDPLPAGASVQLEIVPFGGNSYTALTSSQQGSIGPNGLVSAGDVVGEAFHVIPVLTRATTPTISPILRRWTVRSIIVAARQDQIVVPIIWADEVDSPVGDGTKLPQDLVAEWEFLKGIETSGEAVIYQEGNLAYVVYIDQVELDQPYAWNDTKSMLQGVLNVKLLTVN